VKTWWSHKSDGNFHARKTKVRDIGVLIAVINTLNLPTKGF